MEETLDNKQYTVAEIIAANEAVLWGIETETVKPDYEKRCKRLLRNKARRHNND